MKRLERVIYGGLVLVLLALLLELTGCAPAGEVVSTPTPGPVEAPAPTSAPTPAPEEKRGEFLGLPVDDDGEDNVDLPAWAAAYWERAQQMAAESDSGELLFGLAYLDDDQVPELVADVPGYYLRLLTYVDGKLYWFNEPEEWWPYGAGGCPGYDYLPRQGVVYTTATDFAGLIRYDTYYRLTPEHRLERWGEPLRMCFFEDLNGNGEPDEGECGEELTAMHFFCGDEEVTEEAYDACRLPGEYLPLEGVWTLEELLEQLTRLAKDG